MREQAGSDVSAGQRAVPFDCGPPSPFAELDVRLEPYTGSLEPSPPPPQPSVFTRISRFCAGIFKH